MPFDSIYDIAKLLWNNHHLQSLDISSNHEATTKGSLIIFHSLEDNKGLISLYLNNIVATD
jgi:hypothetical protein